MIDPAGAAVILSALTTVAAGVRKWITARDKAAYERARADMTAEEAKAALATKNRELTMLSRQNEQLQDHIDRLTKSIDRITAGGSPQ